MAGLYIHIPFCVKKCNYCDFNSYGGFESLFEDYFLCLKKELSCLKEKVFDTVYIGGGTPTAPPNKYLTDLIENIPNLKKVSEITVECNPGTVSGEELHRLRESGANRLSIGLQSANENELRLLGRIHSFNDFENCFKNARKAGFENISADIMFGLPNQTISALSNTLGKVSMLEAEHISAYCLKIEEGTPFAKMKLTLPSDDECADMYDFCVDFLAENGYERYEISNFAKNKKISVHNSGYWRREDYIGIGAGAYSLWNGRRFSRKNNVREYINLIKNGENAVENVIPLTKDDEMSEFVFLGLRMAEGISEAEFLKNFGKDIFSVYGKSLEKYLNMKVMERKNGRIFIKSGFLYVSNNILSDFV